MPQPAINIAKNCFVTSNGKVRNYNISNNNILYHLLGGFKSNRRMSIKDARTSPQATTLVAIEYGLYLLLLLPC